MTSRELVGPWGLVIEGNPVVRRQPLTVRANGAKVGPGAAWSTTLEGRAM
ncbi:hypothetical protein [Streptomyces buecherae]